MYKYFTEEELKCKCGCEEEAMDSSFMILLEDLRAEVGTPFIVTSAYRCPEYNLHVSSTGENGPHTTGKAIDIRANSRLKFEIIEALFANNINVGRIGVGKDFIHLDSLSSEEGFPHNVIWTY